MPTWDAGQRDLATAGLKDADPFVRRCAADALGSTLIQRTSARCST